jgi:hypothetical protein
LAPAISAIVGWIAGFAGALINFITGAIGPWWSAIQAVVGGVLNIFQGLISFISGVFTGNWAAAWNGIKEIFSGFGRAIGGAVNYVMSLIRGIPGLITGIFGGAGSWLVNAGRSIIEGFWHGIESMIGWVKSQVSGFLSSIRNLWPFSPAKEGPFSGRGWVLYSGMSIGAAFGEGIAGSTGAAVAAAQSMLGTVQSALGAGATVPVGAAPAGAAAGGGGAAAQPVVIRIDSAGSALDDLLVQVLQRSIRNQGGNVQAVLGS